MYTFCNSGIKRNMRFNIAASTALSANAAIALSQKTPPIH